MGKIDEEKGLGSPIQPLMAKGNDVFSYMGTAEVKASWNSDPEFLHDGFAPQTWGWSMTGPSEMQLVCPISVHWGSNSSKFDKDG